MGVFISSGTSRAYGPCEDISRELEGKVAEGYLYNTIKDYPIEDKGLVSS